MENAANSHNRHDSIDPISFSDTQTKLQQAFNKDETMKKLEDLLNFGSAQKMSIHSSNSPAPGNKLSKRNLNQTQKTSIFNEKKASNFEPDTNVPIT